MDLQQIIADIDAEIARLQKAREALTGSVNGRGRRGRRKMSAATRNRMAKAMRARWTKAKKAGRRKL